VERLERRIDVGAIEAFRVKIIEIDDMGLRKMRRCVGCGRGSPRGKAV
jgi:hypothetical protein